MLSKLYICKKLKILIKATNIHKSYGDLHVLKGIDLTVEKGEIISIVGKSGAGKSTLLHILGTLDLPDKGSLELNNTNVSNLSQKEMARFRNKNIGFIFQFHHLLNEFTAEENVAIPAFIAGEPKQKSLNRAKELLDYLGLAERITHKPNELSGGEQQRVAVARALMNDPFVVFADEPSGNLDKATSNDLHNLLFKLRDEMNQTFVIVTHNEELASLSDRTITMEDGLIR